MGELSLFIIYIFVCLVGAIDLDPISQVTDDVDPSSVVYDIGNARIIFNQYVKEYNKVYESEEEYEIRYDIFVKNLEEINRKNRRSQSEIYGITTFVDLTAEEFLAKFTGFAYNGRRSNFENESIAVENLLTDGESPDRYDWREKGVVTEVKNQGDCNSCWAFAGVGTAESQFAIKHSKLLSLSEQQMLDCWSKSGGCLTGNFPHSGLNAIAAMGGFMSSSEYPYRFQDGPCKLDKKKIVVRVESGYVIKVNNEEQLKKLLHQNGPLAIALYVSKSFSTYKGRIFMPTAVDCPPNEQPNHAMLLIGYGEENGVPYWIIKNSYGSNWGEQGYMKLVRGKNVCSLLWYVSAAKVY